MFVTLTCTILLLLLLKHVSLNQCSHWIPQIPESRVRDVVSTIHVACCFHITTHHLMEECMSLWTEFCLQFRMLLVTLGKHVLFWHWMQLTVPLVLYSTFQFLQLIQLQHPVWLPLLEGNPSVHRSLQIWVSIMSLCTLHFWFCWLLVHTQACNETSSMHIVATTKSISNIHKFFSLEGDFQLLYVARRWGIAFIFFKQKINLYKQIFQPVNRTLYTGRIRAIFG